MAWYIICKCEVILVQSVYNKLWSVLSSLQPSVCQISVKQVAKYVHFIIANKMFWRFSVMIFFELNTNHVALQILYSLYVLS